MHIINLSINSYMRHPATKLNLHKNSRIGENKCAGIYRDHQGEERGRAGVGPDAWVRPRGPVDSQSAARSWRG